MYAPQHTLHDVYDLFIVYDKLTQNENQVINWY